MTLIMRRLQDIGISIGESNSIYGAYTTLAVPVFSLVPSLIAPISMALVPQLAAFVEKKNISGQSTVVENSMRLTVLLALPASLGLVAFARPMLDVIFAGQTYAVEIAAPLLSVLGASVLFSCLITTTNAILQSYGKTTLPIISMFIGVAVKFAVSYVLIGNEFFGVMGAPIGSLACNITVTAINIVFMCNNKDVIIDIKKIFFKPAWISLLSVGVAFAVYIFMFETLKSSLSALVLAIVVAVLIYFVFSRIAGSITDDDILSLPFGEKLMGRRDKDKKTKEKRKNDGESNCCTKKKGAS
jgi:stage V sporulation protein B